MAADDFEPETTTPLETFLSKAGESVPIIGAPFRKATAYLESLSPFFSMRHLERGEGAAPQTYEQALANENALMAQRAAEHPGWTTGGNIVGNVAGFAALPAASMASLPAAALTTGGVTALDKAARGGTAKEVAGAGLGGAAGGAAGYVAGRVLSRALGSAADWLGKRASGATTAPNMKDITNVAKTLELEKGGYAALMREQGVIGGAKSLPQVAERAEAATEHVSGLYRNLIDRADASGKTINLNEALASIENVSKKGVRPKYLERAIQEAKDELRDIAGVPIPGEAALKKAGLTAEQFEKLNPAQITHRQFQDWLATRSEEAGGIFNELQRKNAVSATDRAFHRVYTAGRDFQDEALGKVSEGLGDTARTLRREIALNSTVARVAKNRSEMLSSQNPLGLIGSGAALAGAAELAHGNVKEGALLLTLALGKATAPYRANLLTSAASIPQQALEQSINPSGLPAILTGTLGARAGASLGEKYLPPHPHIDDFEPEPPLVSRKGK